MKKMVFACVCGLAIFACTSMGTIRSVASARNKPVLVVATFDARGVGADDVEFVMTLFTSNFVNVGYANIVDRSSFDKIKKELSFQDSDWSDSTKVAELGRALNANQVAVGQLIKRGSSIFLTIKILDVNTTTIIASHLDKVASIDDFLTKMPDFCNALIGRAGRRRSFSASSSGSSALSSSMQGLIPYGKYEIGDIGPGGGIVFYTSEDGFYVYDGKGGKELCHYLEMSRNTLGESKWFPKYSTIGTRTGLGYGRANTYKILNASTSTGLTKKNCAAYRTSKYSTASTKAGEWWLPSKDELGLIYKNQKDAVLASCTEKRHWSSSEDDDKYAWIQNFGFGDWTHYTYKVNAKFSVCAARAF